MEQSSRGLGGCRGGKGDQEQRAGVRKIGNTKVRLSLLLLVLLACGLPVASPASASSVSVTDFRMYNGGTLVSPATAPAGSQRGFWINVRFTNGITAGQTINITGPTGASFSTDPNNYILNWPGATIRPSAASALSGGRGVALTVPSTAPAVGANDTRYVTFGGGFPNVSLTGVGTEVGNRSLTVSTTNDADAASTPTYEVTPGPIDHIGVPGGGAISAAVGTNFSSSGQAIAALDAYDNLIPGAVIDLSTPASGASGTFAGGVRTTSVTMLSGGQALIPTTTANTVAGSWTMTASAPGATSNTIPRINTAGAPAAVSLALSPTSIVANGTSKSTATATVTDTYGNKVTGQTVTMSANGPTVGAVTNLGDGTFTAQVTSSTTAGSFSVTATDTTPNPDIVSSPATLTQTAGPPTQIVVPAGISTTVNTAFASQSITVRDANNNPVSGRTVTLTTPNSGASGTFAGNSHSTTVTTNGSGVANIPTTTANTTAGSWSMTASISGGPSNTLSRTNNAAAPSSVTLALNPTSIVADGTSKSTATATVTDAYGNRITGQAVSMAANGPTVGAVADAGDGTYTAQVTSSTTAGSFSVTATDTTPNPDIVSGPAALTQTAGPPAQISVPAGISTIVNTAFASQTITVSDANGNPVPGQVVSLTTPETGASATFAGDNHSTTTTTDISGVASIPTTTANSTAGVWSMTASISGGPGNTLSRTNEPGAAVSVLLSLDPASIPADGTSRTTATAEVQDSFGNPVPGENVSFSAGGGQVVGAVTDQGDGSYSAEVSSTTTPGDYVVTVTDHTPSPPVSGDATLTQTSVTPPVIVVKPVLKFVKPPKQKVKSARVSFRFKVVKGKAKGFQCKLDRQKWARCKSPKPVRLKKGKHVFKVRGIATNGKVGKPIVRKIRRVG